MSQFELVVAGRLTEHRATADVASEPEDQQNNQHKTEQSAAVVWRAPPGTTAVIVATASAKEKHQDDNQEDQRDGYLSPSEFTGGRGSRRDASDSTLIVVSRPLRRSQGGPAHRLRESTRLDVAERRPLNSRRAVETVPVASTRRATRVPCR